MTSRVAEYYITDACRPDNNAVPKTFTIDNFFFECPDEPCG